MRLEAGEHAVHLTSPLGEKTISAKVATGEETTKHVLFEEPVPVVEPPARRAKRRELTADEAWSKFTKSKKTTNERQQAAALSRFLDAYADAKERQTAYWLLIRLTHKEGRSKRVVRLADRYLKEFKQGDLREEILLFRVRALVDLKSPEAKKAADAFIRAYPLSPNAQGIRSLVE